MKITTEIRKEIDFLERFENKKYIAADESVFVAKKIARLKNRLVNLMYGRAKELNINDN